MSAGASFNDRNEIIAPQASTRFLFLKRVVSFILIVFTFAAFIVSTNAMNNVALAFDSTCLPDLNTGAVPFQCNADGTLKKPDKDKKPPRVNKNDNCSRANQSVCSGKTDGNKKNDNKNDKGDTTAKDDSSDKNDTSGGGDSDSKGTSKNDNASNVTNDNWWNNFTCGATGDLGWNTAYTVFQAPLFDDGLYGAKWSIQNIYGDSIKWSNFNGTKSPKYFNKESNRIFPNKDDDSSGVKAPDYKGTGDIDGARKAADSSHTAGKCVMNGLINIVAQNIFNIAQMTSTVISFFVAQAVNPAVICQSAKGGTGCINLLAAIGGDGLNGSNSGIIGRLYSGLYLGLTTIVFAIVGMWMLWNGIAKHRTRMALSGFAWAFGIFLVGCAVGSAPLLVAEAPMRVATTLGACVIQSMNGVNCMQPNATTKNNGDSNDRSECYIDTTNTDIGIDQMLAIEAKQSSCIVWRAFVLQPWSMGQFGKPYDELYTDKTTLLSNLKDPSKADYWKKVKVSLYSDSTSNPMAICQNAKEGGQWTYSNIALYQLDLQSSVHDCTGSPIAFLQKVANAAAGSSQTNSSLVNTLTQNTWAPKGSNNGDYHSSAKINTNQAVYADWYYMIDLMGQVKQTNGTGDKDVSDTYYWWSGEHPFGRIKVAMMAVVSTFAAAAILITTALMAIMYLVSGTILTAFAPLFLLFGIVPGQGKRIFLGYLEQLISSVLKYLACILWMVVTIEVYGAVLSTDMSIVNSLMFIIIVTMAMWMYRKEFINMIGRCNLGGQQLTNHVGEKFGRMARRAGSKAMALGNAAIGAEFASRAMHETAEERRGTVRRNVTAELSRGTGIVANATRAVHATHDRRNKQAAEQLEHQEQKIQKATADTGTTIMNEFHVSEAALDNAQLAVQQVERRYAPKIAEAQLDYENHKNVMDELANINQDEYAGNMSSSYRQLKTLEAAARAQNHTNKDEENLELYKRRIRAQYDFKSDGSEDNTMMTALKNADDVRSYNDTMRAINTMKARGQDGTAQYERYKRQAAALRPAISAFKAEQNRRSQQILTAHGMGTYKGWDDFKQTVANKYDAVKDLKNQRDGEAATVTAAINEYQSLDRLRKTVENNRAAYTQKVSAGQNVTTKDLDNINTSAQIVDSASTEANVLNKTHYDPKTDPARSGRTRAGNNWEAASRSINDLASQYQQQHGMDETGLPEFERRRRAQGGQPNRNYQDASDPHSAGNVDGNDGQGGNPDGDTGDAGAGI